ncbi:DUF4221 family protein [Algoriphagus halophilus]|uniref:DUF4221 family protein n=1 Tax=Algoriphagus halophilus TaxID=226505 RepID=UPI00358F2D84
MKLRNILIFFIFFYGCKTPDEKINNEEEQPSVIEEKSYKLPLDSETSLYNRLNDVGDIDGQESLLLFNQNANTLQVYDLGSETLKDKIKFPWEGPNSLQGIMFPYGFHYINPDSLIFYSGMFKIIYLANLNGEVYNEISLSDHSNGFGSVLPRSPIAYKDGNVYMQSLPRLPVQIPEDYIYPSNKISKINLDNGTYEEFELDFPEIYDSKVISQQLKMIDIVYNSKADKFVISFPLSDEIYVTDFKSEPQTYLANSDLVVDPIETNKNNTIVSESSLGNFYYWMNSSYDKIIYDSENDVYIRQARAGLSEQQYLNKEFKSKKELIILNSDFNIINKIPYESAEMYYYFFKDERFFWNKNIQEFNLQAGVEDTLFFDSVKLKIN